MDVTAECNLLLLAVPLMQHTILHFSRHKYGNVS